MTEDDHSSRDEANGPTSTLDTTLAVSSSYKVLGEDALATGAGVLGRNTAGSGTPIGVEGTAPNTGEGYGLATPDDARIEGAIDTNETDFVVDAGATSGGRNVVMGHADNGVQNGPGGAAIAGGGSGSNPNLAYDDHAAIVGGLGNQAGTDDSDPSTARHSFVGGGKDNAATDVRATVAGGLGNEASGLHTSVGGGSFNQAGGGSFATVAGGTMNQATEFYATVAGGANNQVYAEKGTVAGGGWTDTNNRDTTANVVHNDFGFVGGGGNNQAGTSGSTSETYAVVSGGRSNHAANEGSFVGGGKNNEATDTRATVAGGLGNTSSGLHTSVGGGSFNTAGPGSFATVAGGNDNVADSFYATVAGGANNQVLAEKGTVGGGGFTDSNNRDATANRVYDRFGTVAGGGNNQAGKDDGDSTTQQYATVGGGENNTAEDEWSTVGGGQGNDATGRWATIGGGDGNSATGGTATIAGGAFCEAGGTNAAVPGGYNNTANGAESFAAGGWAKAADTQSFVWNDGSQWHDTNSSGSADAFSSSKAVNTEPVTGSDTFNVSATGGVRFVTGGSSVTYISGGSTGWSTASSRAFKTNVAPFEPEAALEGVESLEVCTWEYEDDDGEGAGVTHVGPMAEAFHEAFDVGDSDEHINAINADGVALAAIQGLSEKVEETVAEKDDRIEELEAENDRLRERLEAVEAHLDLEEPAASPADD